MDSSGSLPTSAYHSLKVVSSAVLGVPDRLAKFLNSLVTQGKRRSLPTRHAACARTHPGDGVRSSWRVGRSCWAISMIERQRGDSIFLL